MGFPPDLPSLLLGWRIKTLSLRGKEIWKIVPAVIYWLIWLERNNRVFEGASEPSFQVYKRVKDKIIWWGSDVSSAKGPQKKLEWFDWF